MRYLVLDGDLDLDRALLSRCGGGGGAGTVGMALRRIVFVVMRTYVYVVLGLSR